MRGNEGRSLATLAICGGIGGVIGASCMTVVRIVAQRAGHIDKQVPQAAEEWLLHRVGADAPGGHAGHHALDQLLHLSYGAAWGVLYGVLLGRGSDHHLARGALFGIGEYLIAAVGIMPILRVARPPWEGSGAETAVNVGSHILWGTVTALLAEELSGQTGHGPSTDTERLSSRVG